MQTAAYVRGGQQAHLMGLYAGQFFSESLLRHVGLRKHVSTGATATLAVAT
jgi:hypothetical protein